jgi:hypothetical protein
MLQLRHGEDYIACWMEIIVDEPSDMDAKQIVLLGTDLQCRLNGRCVAVRNRQDEAASPRMD